MYVKITQPITIGLVLIGICLMMWCVVISSAQEAFDCSTITDVSQYECEALVELYDDTNGHAWNNATNWLQTDEVCQWEGIECSLSDMVFSPGGALYCPLERECRPIVVSISVSNQGLDGPLPISIGGLEYLRQLDVSNNPELIGRVPITVIYRTANIHRYMIGPLRLSFSGTNLCEPPDASYQQWKASVAEVSDYEGYDDEGTGIVCETETMFAKVYMPILAE